MTGRVIGNYQIVSELTPGRVYLARPQGQSTELVIRKIPFAGCSPVQRVQLKSRLRRVAWFQFQLKHAAIARLVDSFQTEQAWYLVSEYVPGTTLRELLQRQGPPTPVQALNVCRQALGVLEYLHNLSFLDEADLPQTGLLHGDLKPESLVLDAAGRLRIVEVGTANLPDSPTFSYTGLRPGTLEYMAPELLRGDEPDPRTDIFSLGVLIYELLTGYHPYLRMARRETESPGSPAAGARLYFDAPAQPIDEIRTDLEPGLSRLLMPALERRPAARYATATAFLQAIDEYEAGLFETRPVDPPAGPLHATPASERTAGNSRPPASSPGPTGSGRLREPVVISINASPRSLGSPGSPGNRGTGASPSRSRKTGIRRFLPGAILFLLIAVIAGRLLVDGEAILHAFGRFLSGTDPGNPGIGNQVTVDSPLSPSTSPPTGSPATGSPTAGPSDGPPEGRLVAIRRLAAARDADQNGRFAQAVQLYEEYLQMGEVATESRDVTLYVEKLKSFMGHLEAARLAFERQDLAAARLGYVEALKLRPFSGFARAGLTEVEELLKARERATRSEPKPPATPATSGPAGTAAPPSARPVAPSNPTGRQPQGRQEQEDDSSRDELSHWWNGR
jgi:serine/threonine protein kinase